MTQVQTSTSKLELPTVLTDFTVKGVHKVQPMTNNHIKIREIT